MAVSRVNKNVLIRQKVGGKNEATPDQGVARYETRIRMELRFVTASAR